MGYSPILGRFLQRDPIGYDGGLNLLEYVLSNPTAFVDPFGLQPPTTQPTTPAAPAPPAAPVYPPFIKGQLPTTPPAYAKYPLAGGVTHGMISATLDRNDDYSSEIEIDFHPDNTCNCQEIAFVQYVREITNINPNSKQIAVPQWKLDTKDPYPYPSNPSGHWIPGKSLAKLTDTPGASGPKTAWWFGNYTQVFVTTVYCVKGNDAGKSYGSITWGHYWDYKNGTVGRFVEDQVSTGNPAQPFLKLGGSVATFPAKGSTTRPTE